MIEFIKSYEFEDEDEDIKCKFDIIFWSYLRHEWVVRFQDSTGEYMVEFYAHELCDALWWTIKEAIAPGEYETIISL